MGYLFFEIISEQLHKKNNLVSGDVVKVFRDDDSTYCLLVDGQGSGIKANLSATMCASKIENLIRAGYSLNETFERVCRYLESIRGVDDIYSVFSIARVMEDGLTVIYNYDMPEPLIVSNKRTNKLKGRKYFIEKREVIEYQFQLKENEFVLLVSDGIIQSGIGTKYPAGFGTENLIKHINNRLEFDSSKNSLLKNINEIALFNWDNIAKDDLTSIMIYPRRGIEISLLTGPPENIEDDEIFAERFMEKNGPKIICGASSAKIIAKHLNEELTIDDEYYDSITPPNYNIEGIELVTEGAITLNQLYNVWDEDDKLLDKNNPVTVLFSLLRVADKINLFIGKSVNPATKDFAFKQQGILSRKNIVSLLINKFKEQNKIVNEYYF